MRNLPRSCNQSVRPQRRYLVTAVIASLLVWTPDLLAQVATDGSVGAQQNFSGAMIIPENLGRLSGTNLFHSFSIFNINAGESANFTTSTSGITNVISRVTGGSESLINGSLSLTPVDGSPNFFFINPAGMTFGAGASINVPGAFHVSTADYVRFDDGNFYANPNLASTFSSAAPEAFGFLGNTRASITVQAGALLMAQPGQAISLIAGDIRIDNGVVRTRSGDLRVFALGQQAQEVGLSGALPAAAGNIDMSNGGRIIATGFGTLDNGNISVGAGNMTIAGLGTGILNNAVAGTTGNAGNVDVTVTGDIVITAGGSIASNTFTASDAGNITVSAANLLLSGQGLLTGIFSQTQNDASNAGITGNAGSVGINASGDIFLYNGGQISANTFTSGTGGAVTVFGDNITIDRLDQGSVTGIFSTASAGTGNAGSVGIVASHDILMLRGGEISSNTLSLGDAGVVSVTAQNLTMDGQGINTSLGSRTLPTAANGGITGNAGSVVVNVTGQLNLFERGVIQSDTNTSGNAGSVVVNAGNITIDRRTNPLGTGILSQAFNGTGNAGSIVVNATGDILLVNGGTIAANTRTAGSGGSVNVTARNLTIDRQGSGNATSISAEASGSGNAGDVNVVVSENLQLLAGGQISSSTSSSGNAGTVNVDAGNITIDRLGTNIRTGVFSQATGTGNAGNVSVSADDLNILNGGEISTNTFTVGNAGTINIDAGSLLIDGRGLLTGIFSQARAGSGNAGSVDVQASTDISILGGGQISANTFTSGAGGNVTVTGDNITINRLNSGLLTGIFSTASAGSGDAGNVTVFARDDIYMSRGGEISSNTFSLGDAGAVSVSADNLTIDGQGFNTSIASRTQSNAANGGITGNAGSVVVNISGQLNLFERGVIQSDTNTSGNAGSVLVNAGNITIDRRDNPLGTGIFSQAFNGTGNAGSIVVNATDDILLVNGGTIAANTRTVGNGGSVSVTARNLTIDRQGTANATSISAEASGSGDAGNISVAVSENIRLLGGGQISSSTSSSGNAGTINVSAGTITIDRQATNISTGIFSQASGSGNAGNVLVTADDLNIFNGGVISTSTFNAGNAGTIDIDVGNLLIDGHALVATNESAIRSTASVNSSGQTGNINIIASETIALSNGGQISIENAATVSNPAILVPTSISVSAPLISLSSGASITAASTGNVAAGNIRVNFDDRLLLDSSRINTSANLGNGGAIDIQGGDLIFLDNSQITTSVAGLTGNGGDINIGALGLVMQTGFIQANTAAANASGGDVNIDVQLLVPSGNSLFVGGQTPLSFQPGVFGFNVIQAAAPTGVSGNIQITTPALDITGGLKGLSTNVIDDGGLGRNLCQVGSGSSLGPTGRGGLPPSGRNLLRVEDASSAGVEQPGAALDLKDASLALAQSGCVL